VPETSPSANQVSFRNAGGLPDTLQGKDGRATKFVSGSHWTSLVHLVSTTEISNLFPQVTKKYIIVLRASYSPE
jgi:hypothetical protein